MGVPTLGTRLLGLARRHVGIDWRSLVGHAAVSRLGLDCRTMGLGRNTVGLARWLLGTDQLTATTTVEYRGSHATVSACVGKPVVGAFAGPYPRQCKGNVGPVSCFMDKRSVAGFKSSFPLAADFRISESFPAGWPKWKILREHSIVWTGSRHLTPGRPWTGRADWAMAESTLEQVMQAYVDGDATAFDQIYRRVSPSLYSCLLRLTCATNSKLCMQ